MLRVSGNVRTFASSKGKPSRQVRITFRITLKIRERKKAMMLTMISLAIEAVAAVEAMYICKHANVLIRK